MDNRAARRHTGIYQLKLSSLVLIDGLSGHAGATTKACLNVNPHSFMVLFIFQVLHLTKVSSILQQHRLLGTNYFPQGIKPLTF